MEQFAFSNSSFNSLWGDKILLTGISDRHPILSAGTKYWLTADVSNSSISVGWFINDQNSIDFVARRFGGEAWVIDEFPSYLGAFRVMGKPTSGGGPNTCNPPNANYIYAENSGAFGAYEIVKKSASFGNKTNVVFDIKGTLLELIGLPDRTLSFWASINEIKYSPDDVAEIKSNDNDHVGSFFADQKLIPPGSHASFLAKFCKPGEIKFTIGFDKNAIAITIADAIISVVPGISSIRSILSPNKLTKFVDDLNSIPLYSSAMNHVAKAISALERGDIYTPSVEVSAAAIDLVNLAFDQEQRGKLLKAYVKLGIQITTDKLFIALTGAPLSLIKLSADIIALNVMTGFGSKPIIVKLVAPL